MSEQSKTHKLGAKFFENTLALAFAFTVFLVVLRLLGRIDLAWYWVISPLWIYYGAVAAGIVVVALVGRLAIGLTVRNLKRAVAGAADVIQELDDEDLQTLLESAHIETAVRKAKATVEADTNH